MLSMIKQYDHMEIDEAMGIVDAAQISFLSWKSDPFSTRQKLMMRAATILRKNIKDYARLISVEMGKPYVESCAEIEKCAWVCEYYAENGEQFLEDEIIKTDASKSYVTYNPLGVILAVMPWNFPFWQVFRFAAPALMAGNAIVLKHASNVSGCALAIERVFRKAGFSDNIFRTLLINKDQVKEVISHKYIQAITFTGSTEVGRAIAQEAGKYAKKVVLELGGSDPYIILKDADIDNAARVCVTSRMVNGGQSCVAAKRFIVEEPVHNEFVEKVITYMQAYTMGDPLQEGTKLGPLASKKQRDDLHKQVKASIAKGAKCLLGGETPSKNESFYPPTVLTNVSPGMPAYEEELFGPVAAIIKAMDDEDAIRIANDSSFGLGAAIFTSNIKNGEFIARNRIESGLCFVNTMVRSDPRLPFGGVKESGYGRELSKFGIHEFVNIKTVYVE